MNHQPIFLIVDLFCGAGGTTTGFSQAKLEGSDIAKVIACVNHDHKAITSHWMNHPEVKHFEEDIRTLDLTGLIEIVRHYRNIYPDAYLILWASLECTNFSNAKGGQPRDADSRTLADHLPRYVKAIEPDYIQIENVVEFRSWGPLDEKGKPISRKNGSDWMRWRREMCELGYTDQWTEMNSANYGAYTSRNRLFGVFARPWLPIAFPQPTHSKKPSFNGMHGDLQKWKAVKDVLNFSDEGESIFTRKKPLSDKTLERIYAGLIKYVAKGDTAFISKYFSGRPKGKVNSVEDPSSTITTFGSSTLVQTKRFSDLSVEEPAGSITTIDHHSLVQAEFLVKYNSRSKNGAYNPPSIDEPSPVISTQNRLYLAQAQFLAGHYSSGKNISSVESPCPTLSTKDRFQFIQPLFFIDKTYAGNQNTSNIQSIDSPAGTILTNDKHRLIQCDSFLMPTNYDNTPKSLDEPSPTITANRKHHYIVNPSHGGHSTSTENPCPVIVARQDKVPLYLVQAESGKAAIAVFECDSEVMIRIKVFMSFYGLVDIKMRMLRVLELLSIQGFPHGYKLDGNQTDQKKFIGNSVVPHVVKAWCEAMALRLIEDRQKVA
jgi:DNA (cytosine-5)-methyltransferase 1